MGSSMTFAPYTEDIELMRLAVNGVHAAEHVELQFLPVHDLYRGRVAALFCTPVFALGETAGIAGYRAFQHIGPRQFPALDQAILQHAVSFAHRTEDEAIAVFVALPVNFDTLVRPKTRADYLEALRESDTVHNGALMLKIEDVPTDAADSVLAEMVGAVKPYVRRVFVHLSENDPRFLDARYIGAAGYVGSLPPRATRPMAMAAAKSLTRMCVLQSAFSCIDNVPDADALEIMRVAGIRFAAGGVFGAEIIHYDTPLETILKIVEGEGHRANREAVAQLSL
jgi:hypothetical protein